MNKNPSRGFGGGTGASTRLTPTALATRPSPVGGRYWGGVSYFGQHANAVGVSSTSYTASLGVPYDAFSLIGPGVVNWLGFAGPIGSAASGYSIQAQLYLDGVKVLDQAFGWARVGGGTSSQNYNAGVVIGALSEQYDTDVLHVATFEPVYFSSSLLLRLSNNAGTLGQPSVYSNHQLFS